MKILTHKFVEFIPDKLEDNFIYISIEYSTVAHKCCCGCGNEVVTPLSPTDWEFTFNGESISLYPSIGNWGFECQSHYWIKNNKVIWVEKWSVKRIKANRLQDQFEKEEYYNKNKVANVYKHNVIRKQSLIKKIQEKLLSWFS